MAHRSRRRDEQGAVLPFVAILLVLIFAIASLAVDLGQARVGRRDMQALADVVALDLSRQVDGRKASEILADPLWDSGRRQSVARNPGTYGATPTVTAQLGVVNPTTGAFTAASGATVPDAVRVLADTRVRMTFTGKNPDVSRTSTAIGRSPTSPLTRTRALGCFALGSYAAAVREGNGGLLSTLLGQVNSALGLGVVGYQGLLDADISLGQLATALGVGDVSALATTTVTYRQLYLAAADVLTQGGNAADASVLRSIAVAMGSAGTLPLGSLLVATQAAGAGADAAINAVDLIAGSVLAFNGTNALSIPSLSTNLGLARVSSTLKVVEGPQTACSEPNPVPVSAGEARTAQVTATVSGSVSGIAVPGFLSLNVGSPATRPTTTTLSLASAKGHLTDVRCPTGASSASGITVATTSGLASVATSIPLEVSGKVSVAGIGLVDLTISVDMNITTGAGSGVQASTAITVPPQSFDTPYATSSGPLQLSSTSVVRTNQTVTARLLGIGVTLQASLIDSILNSVTQAVVVPLVNNLNANLVYPLTSLAGVDVAGADVIALDNPLPPTCYTSYIVGP